MKKFLFLITILATGWHLNDGKIPFLSPAGAYNEAGSPAVWLFTVDGCGKPCVTARYELQHRRIDYVEKRINPHGEDTDDVKFWSREGRNSFPLIAVGDEIVNGSSHSALASALALTFGETYLTRNERALFSRHFYEDGSPRIVMYGADWCGYCRKLRTEFENDDIDYVEVDVEKSAYKTQITRTMEIGGYPATWVGYTRVKGTTLSAVKSTLRSY